MPTRVSTGGGGGGHYVSRVECKKRPPRGETFGTFFQRNVFLSNYNRMGHFLFEHNAKSVFPVFDQKW